LYQHCVREVLVRQKIVLKRGWLFFIVLSICMAVSAAYELLEWRVAIGTGSAGFGALTALLFFSRWHDRLIGRMEATRRQSNPRDVCGNVDDHTSRDSGTDRHSTAAD
jgi:uncharacterized membrane protein YjdF